MTITIWWKRFCLAAMWIVAMVSSLIVYAHLLWPVSGTWLLGCADRAMAVATAGGAGLATLRGVLAESVPALILVGLTAHASRITANSVMASIFSYFARQEG